MDSPSSSASSECSFELPVFDQNLLECLEKEPITIDMVDKKNLPMPTWRKHKLMVNIQEKGGNVGRFDEIDRHVYGEINEARFKNLRKIQPSEKHRPKEIQVKETDDFKVSLSRSRLSFSSKETMEQRSDRLVFESKRKAFYLDEGSMFKRYHKQNTPIISEDVLKSPLRSALIATSPKYNQNEWDHEKEKEVTTKPPMKLGKPLHGDPPLDTPKKKVELSPVKQLEDNKKPPMKLGKSELTMRGADRTEHEKRSKSDIKKEKKKQVKEAKPKYKACPEEEEEGTGEASAANGSAAAEGGAAEETPLNDQQERK